ncbi:hypothetical protein [Lunatibacter salilacus]|uniref:hypothetical protein n=1 Tax=Lunatibacter salilacus TaxID=2483804 RepID=UPI00131A93DB|nr:hypothetical protein [Lunatibacter salilacus]
MNENRKITRSGNDHNPMGFEELIHTTDAYRVGHGKIYLEQYLSDSLILRLADSRNPGGAVAKAI